MKKALVTGLLVITLAAGTVNCRMGFAAARLGTAVAAAALVTAIHVAAWYSLAHAVVVYPDYYNTAVHYRIHPGTRIYVVQRHGQWCRVRTADGRVGWVYYTHLSGHVHAAH